MDFELVLLLLFVFSGLFWLSDLFYFKNKRENDIRPIWLEYTAGFFPVIFVVFVIRSFIFEPFNIPSGSMIPTLKIGDLILVNKYEYGLNFPVFDKKILENKKPSRGDVAVFKWPKDKSLDYIKRIVGLPGDQIVYQDKIIKLNGVPITRSKIADYIDSSTYKVSSQYTEKLGSKAFNVLTEDDVVDIYLLNNINLKDMCQRIQGGISCKVPLDHYFVLGDNRDNSSDSRYWGFVPKENLVGKAFLVWFNFDDVLNGRFDRLGFLE